MDSSGRHETGTLKSLKIYKGYQQSCDTVKNPWYTKERNNNQIGDKVRFLSEVGGGVVTGFQGKDMVLVEDADGFDIPMPIKECVVIDTDDYNMKRKPVAPAPKQEVVSAKAKGASVKVRQDEEEDERPITYRPAERKGGDILNVMLAASENTVPCRNGFSTSVRMWMKSLIYFVRYRSFR